MRRAIALSLEMMRSGRGGPFGAVVVKDGKIVAEGFNQVISTNDPTAHAEVVAVRLACQALGTFDLTDCEIYSSCEPCPMCLGAIYWARLGRIYYANDRHDAARIGFRDDFLYHEIPLPLEQRTIPIQPLLRLGDSLLVPRVGAREDPDWRRFGRASSPAILPHDSRALRRSAPCNRILLNQAQIDFPTCTIRRRRFGGLGGIYFLISAQREDPRPVWCLLRSLLWRGRIWAIAGVRVGISRGIGRCS
jgi:guanine deaminase